MESSDLARQFVRHRDMLYGYVFALTRDHGLAEDLLQDVGVSILTEAARGTVPGEFVKWARGLARHRVADYFRRVETRRRHELPFEEFADAVDLAFGEHAPSPEDDQERLQFLRECLGALTARVRSIIDLKYRDRRSIEEIAASLSWTAGSVKVALSRARRALADCVGRRLRREEAAR
ncbi:MAG: RNA polymerase sigma factor [Phycisphaerae bacterium]